MNCSRFINNRLFRARFLATALCLAAAAILLFGCSKKSGLVSVSVSETHRMFDTLSVTSDTLPVTSDTLPVKTDTFTDARDGKTYRTVKMPDGEIWMAENLNYKADSSWCYQNADSNCVKYGRLYDWNTAMTACPAGWHLPTAEEWDSLGLAAGYKPQDYTDADTRTIYGAGKKLKATSGWDKNWYNGTDDYGFSALPGGYRTYVVLKKQVIEAYGYENFYTPPGYVYRKELFLEAGERGIWWTAAPGVGYIYGLKQHNRRQMSASGNDVELGGSDISEEKSNFSVRCLIGEPDAALLAEWEKWKEKVGKRQKELEAEQHKKEEMAETERKKEERRIAALSVYFTDSRDGRKYRAVKIGGKTWMAQNLNYETDSSWCYDNDTSNCMEYGRFYVWNTAKTACPAGWHLPSLEEWQGLMRTAGGRRVHIDWMSEKYIIWKGVDKKLKTKNGWIPFENDGGNGTDDYGFSALPVNCQTQGSRGLTWDAGYVGTWWTATENVSDSAYIMYMDHDGGIVNEGYGSKSEAISVRCLQNANR
jgi:uncharacterized protein (TIGR02145 family)